MTAVLEQPLDDPSPDPPSKTSRRLRLTVSLPEALYHEVKARDINVRDVLRAEVVRQQKCEAIDEYIADLVAKVGEPSAEDETRAAEFMDRLLRRQAGEAE